MPGNGWEEWRKYIRETLKSLDESSQQQGVKLDDLHVQVARLETKFKSRLGLWGFVGGLVPALIGAIVYLAASL